MSEDSLIVTYIMACFAMFVLLPLGVLKFIEIVIYLTNHSRLVP